MNDVVPEISKKAKAAIFKHYAGYTMMREDMPEASCMYDMSHFRRVKDIFFTGAFLAVKGRVAEVLSKFDFGAGRGLVPYPIYEADEKTPLLVEPMTRDRITIARAGGEGKVEETAGIAIWASVSDEVDAKIREQIRARVFPIRLKSEDWASGDTTWLLDVIAPSQKVATAVLANFKQVRQGQAGPHPSADQPARRSRGAGKDEGAAGGRGRGQDRDSMTRIDRMSGRSVRAMETEGGEQRHAG